MFIVSPRIGLCNQLQSIVKTFLLGIKYNRSIYIDKFQIDLESGRLTDINEILDIDKMNHFYAENNINIKINKNMDDNILSDLENYKLKEINYDNLSNISFINDIIENNMDKQIIYIGNPVSLCISNSFNLDWSDYKNLYFFLMTNLIFKQSFYDLKDHIKNQLNLTNFTTIHLRIEDDAIKHFAYCYNLTIDEYNKILLDYYTSKINNQDKKIYICSGILEYSNTINFDFYNKLLDDNNNKILDKRNIIISDYIKHNRELIAIVDLLIAFDSENFVGCWISSFSQIINTYFINKNKPTDLFKL
jgi:hypothetical protein